MIREKVSSLTNEFRRLKKSLFTRGSFAQNFAFVFSGKAVGILVQIIFAPILARIYSPEAYGVYSVFTAVTVNLALVSTLRMEGAFVLPKEELEFRQLLKTVFLVSVFFSELVLIASLVAHDQIVSALKAGEEGWLYYCIGPAVFLVCLFQMTNNWVIRNKAFKDAFHYGVPVNVGTRIFNVGYGLLTRGLPHGLILSDLLSKLVTVYLRLAFILKSGFSFLSTPLSWKQIKENLRRYRQFPLYDMPGNWVNLFSSQLPIYIVTFTFGSLASNYVGQLGFAINLLDVPMALLGSSMAPVFLQRISEARHRNAREIGDLTVSLYRRLLYLGILPFAVITVFGEFIFGLVFGSRWALAGTFTACLGVYYLFRLISSPLSSVFIVFEKQQKLFLFQIFLFAGRAAVLVVGAFVIKDIFWVVLLFGVFNAVAYFMVSLWIMHVVGARKLSLVIETFLLVSVVIGLLFLIKQSIGIG